MPADIEPPRRIGFAATALFIYLILLAGYVLSYVHRTAPAAIAGELTQAFQVSGALLGTLAATYFYVYTVLQVPVGVLADTVGPRVVVTAGAVVAAVGSILFGLAPGWELAAVGRLLVGMGYTDAGDPSDVTAPGTFCVHGDAVDVFPAQATSPVRLEFFGDEVDRVRRMVPSTGQTIGVLESVTVSPCREIALKPASRHSLLVSVSCSSVTGIGSYARMTAATSSPSSRESFASPICSTR